MKKTVLVIGGAGFIGSNVARYFFDKGWNAIILDNFSRRGTEHNVRHLKKDYPGRFTVVRADVTKDLKKIASAVKKADAVVHNAAQVAATTSIENPRHDFMTNALGTFNVLEAVRLGGKNQPVIFSSTNKVYGALSQHPSREGKHRYEYAEKNLREHGIAETEQLDFYSPYGCSKGSADQYAIDYSRIYGMNTVVFRQSTIYGPHQFGIEDQGWIAWFAIVSMLKRKLTIFGTGKQVRDPLFVRDLAELYYRSVMQIDKARGNAFNVGGGVKNATSLLELIGILKKEGVPLEVGFGPFRPGDQMVFISDNRKLKKILNWEPTTTLKDGVRQMLLWQKKYEKEIKAFFAPK